MFIFIYLIQFVQAAILYTVCNRRPKMFEYMTAQEDAEKWNVSLRWVQRFAKKIVLREQWTSTVFGLY